MKQLKIVEQIIIVLFFAVMIPFVTIGIIISNVSQQSIRNELENNATLIAHSLGTIAKNNKELVKTQLKEINIDRNIFIIDSKTQNLIETNNKNINYKDVIKDFDFESPQKQGYFGAKKNTPKAYYKLDNPDWTIIVDTTKKVTHKTIIKARYRIILSLCIAALSIIIIVGLYTYYLYINIRQLFKGITAISKGNYDKKIRLIKSAFTPHEIIFLAKEFNFMANKINLSYKDLKRKNQELRKLDEFRNNLISTTSHEFRTPLTNIIGYTSRLLRHDITLDNETKIKSLKIIKQQAQRLSDMVEDLLVIPELESYSLKFNIQEVDLIDSINRTIEYETVSDVQIITDIDKNTPWIWCDESRLEQILINLIDNAIKYSLNKEPISIELKTQNNIPVLKIKNKCEKIAPEIKEKLFDKFIRVDSELTRTTRGTGLGLYIVKAISQQLKIDLSLDVDDEFVITLKFKDYVK